MRRLVRGLLAFILRLFFRRIEVSGIELVPGDGPVIFCPNHPNALIDPALLLVTAPRPVSFLGKAPLFRMPVIGWFARALDSIPVYRKQDGTGDTSRNVEMFAAARALLERGGTLAIFPEGTSHNDPQLKPLRTGAARIALGAGTNTPVRIVPVALTYFAKSVFRSKALVRYGEPITVDAPAPLEGGEPDPDRVKALTAAIAERLHGIMVEADAQEALALAESVERLFLPHATTPEGALAESAVFRRRIVAAYPVVLRSAPARVAAIRRRLDRHEARLRGAGLDPRHLEIRRFTLAGVLEYSLTALLYFALTIGLALPGLLIHWPAYRLIGFLAHRTTNSSEDVLATAKALGAMLLFPLTWLGVGAIVGSRFGWAPGLAATALAPLLGWIGLRFAERFDAVVGSTRALVLWLAGRDRFLRMQVERRWLREDVVKLGREFANLPEG